MARNQKTLKMFTDEDYRKKECEKKLEEVNERLTKAWDILKTMPPQERIEYVKSQS